MVETPALDKEFNLTLDSQPEMAQEIIDVLAAKGKHEIITLARSVRRPFFALSAY